jgi:hypothetical protein
MEMIINYTLTSGWSQGNRNVIPDNLWHQDVGYALSANPAHEPSRILCKL